MQDRTGREYDDPLSKFLYDTRDWVYENYHSAYVAGTGLILYSMWYHDLLVFVGLWLAVLVLGLVLEPCVNPENLLYGWGLVRGGTQCGSHIALTFDDGPGEDTPKILRILRERGIVATFFCTGRQVELHPELVRQIIADGHSIGNHTLDHRSLLACSWGQAHRQVEGLQEMFEHIVGKRPCLVRPPFGFRAPWTHLLLKRLGMTAVYWSVNPRDFQNPGPEVIVQRSVEGVHPGAVVLLHDGPCGRGQTAEALPALIDALSERGYRFITVEQMLARL